jgi:tetratricopeptide (TPR) repeat protein
MASERARSFLRAARSLLQRRTLLRRGGVAFLAICGIIIVVSALYAWQQRRRAEANLQSVILTTKQVVSDTDWELGRVLYTLEPRQALLRYIDDKLASLPEVDKATRAVIVAIAETKHRRSDLARQNESLLQAESFIEEARRQIDKGLQDDSTDHDLLELAALNLSKRGKIEFARGRSEQARAAFAESVALLERIGGDGDDYRRTLATSHAEHAEAELVLGHISTAAALADAAVGLLEQNHEHYDRSQLALALRLRGVAAHSSGDVGAASTVLERARLVQEPLVDSHPGNAYYQWILATIYADLAAVRRREGRLVDADALSRKAYEVADELHRGDPFQKEYALLLCQIWTDLAEAASSRGDQDGAKGARARACEIAARVHDRDSADERFRRFVCP